MSLLNELYQELCLTQKIDKTGLYYRITKALTEHALGAVEEEDTKEEYINGEEFVKRYPFCCISTLIKMHQMSNGFREDCCKENDQSITYCPFQVLKYIVDNKKHHPKYYKRIKEQNFYGFTFN